MKWKIKRFLSSILAVCMLCSILPQSYAKAAEDDSPAPTSTAEHADHEGHAHENDADWKEFTGGSITKSGNYYLKTDITLDSTLDIKHSTESITVNLCLNGHTLRLNEDGQTTKDGYVIRVGYNTNQPATLNLYDCTDNSGKITGGYGHYYSETLETEGGGISIDLGQLNMYGGNICKNQNDTRISGAGGGVTVRHNNNSFTMYGGKIEANTCTGHGTHGSGGGVSVNSPATFTMKGGEIINNTVRKRRRCPVQ